MTKFPRRTVVCIFLSAIGVSSLMAQAQNLEPGFWSRGERLRTIFGFEQAGASSAAAKQNYFIDVFVSAPFPLGKKCVAVSDGKDKVEQRFLVWGDVRLTSIPQQIDTTVSKFSTEFYSRAADLKLNEIARGVEFKAGLEYMIGQICSSDDSVYTLSLIGSAGAITPLNPKEVVHLFKLTPEYKSLRPDLDFTDKEYAAFVLPERDRFYRQYEIGLRFKTYQAPFLDDKGQNVIYPFPAHFDITFGLNDSVTGGELGWDNTVFRVDGFLPVKFDKVRLFLFGNAVLKKSHTKLAYPLFMEPAPDDVKIFSPKVIRIEDREMNRDYYRIGIGVDLSGFVSFLSKKEPAAKKPDDAAKSTEAENK
jgi:hypothetical protein